MSSPDVVAFVHAKGQSSRVPGKNMRKLGDAPMFCHAIRHALACELIDLVVIDSENDEILSMGERYGAKPLKRPDELASNAASGDDLMYWQASNYKSSRLVMQAVPTAPFIRPETIAKLQAARKGGADVVFLGFEAADPGRYGRLVTDGTALIEIVEWSDADEATRAITLCNSGVVLADTDVLLRLVAAVRNDNAAKEFYLTDIAALARAEGLTVEVVTCDESETLGVNTRVDLAAAEAVFQSRARVAAMDNGVSMDAPETVYFSIDTVIGRDTRIEPNVIFAPGVTVESRSHIRAFSHLEGCHVSRGDSNGPYARLRPGAESSEDTRIGNFVEIKNAIIDEGAKVNHLSYIGDAHLGEATNVGAGTITCNYDGVMKHHTDVGKHAFIGSNTMLIAPVNVGDNAMTASGSVINKDVPEGAMAVARASQVNKPGFAVKLFEILRNKKLKRDKGAE